MAEIKWFGETSLATLLAKIKSLKDAKVDKVDGKGLSTEDFTTLEKSKLSGIAEGANNYTLPMATASVLGGVKVGAGLEMDSEGILKVTAQGGVTSVNSKTGAVTLTAGDVGAYTKDEVDAKVTTVYKVKGSVATFSDLPTNASTGDVYNVESDGMNYVWTGSAWDSLGSIIDTSDFVVKSDMVEISADEVNTAWSEIVG